MPSADSQDLWALLSEHYAELLAKPWTMERGPTAYAGVRAKHIRYEVDEVTHFLSRGSDAGS